MLTVQRGSITLTEIDNGVKAAVEALAPDVVRIRYDITEDWIGAPSIFFRIVLRDEALMNADQRELSQRISHRILSEVHPDDLGLQAYFNFRSASEQAQLKEPAWA